MTSRDQILAQLTASGPFQICLDEDGSYPMRVYAHAPASLREVLLSTRRHGDRTFLIYEDESLTFAEHLDRVAALAAHLSAAGVKPGDRVAIGMRNYPEWSVSFWACQAIGAVVVSLNAWWTGAELTFALEDSQACALLLDGERLERLRPSLANLNLRALVIARRGTAGPGGSDMSEITGSRAAMPHAEIGPGDLATILYTSGTTGSPKGAMATQRNHVTNLMNARLNAAVARVMAGLPAEPGPQEPQGSLLATFPFFHIGGLSGLMIGLASGMRVAVMYKWSASLAVELVERHKLASVSGVPIVVRQFLEAATAAGAGLDTVSAISSGGAPVPPDLIRRIGAQFALKAMPGNGYGLTETTSAVVMNSGLDYLTHPQSVGRAMPTAEIRVADEDGQAQASGGIGELWVRGPNVVPGYWRNPKATAAAFKDGWFRSGDLGFQDTEGFYYVVDRIKDVIIRGGENVYCAEVEALILEQPCVLDAAVVGLPHHEYGEEVAAVIQVAPENLDEAITQAVLAPLAERLARFKIPTVVRLTVDELPRTATGKVLKRDLRTRYFELPAPEARTT